jgi:NADPH:quinone reductase-like Zn-dependent oxidoreductase
MELKLRCTRVGAGVAPSDEHSGHDELISAPITAVRCSWPVKAFELHPEEGLAALKVVDRPYPKSLRPHEVCIRVRAVSLNYRDLVIVKNAKRSKRAIVPCSDGAGMIMAVGDEASRFMLGERVMASFFPTWIDGPFKEEYHGVALGGAVDGMLTEQIVLDESALVRIPPEYSLEQAATLPCAAVTAWNALFEAAGVQPGDTVLVQGSGGVSVFALQLAKAAGATVIATSSSAEKRARLEELGAAHTIDYRAEPNWGDAVREYTGGRGVDVAVEVGGAGTFDQTVKALRYGGTMSLIGVLAGTKGTIDTYAVLHKNIRVHGVYVGSVAMFERLVAAMVANKIEPVMEDLYLFLETQAAYAHLESGEHFGKIVIAID